MRVRVKCEGEGEGERRCVRVRVRVRVRQELLVTLNVAFWARGHVAIPMHHAPVSTVDMHPSASCWVWRDGGTSDLNGAGSVSGGGHASGV